MNKLQILATTLLLIGISFLIISYLTGQIQIGFILIFPFIIGTGPNALLGFLCIITAIFLFILSKIHRYTTQQKPSPNLDQSSVEKDPFNKTTKKTMHSGDIILIGPIPIIFGTNWKITLLLLLLAIIITIAVFILL